jgi:hypothetical protein
MTLNREDLALSVDEAEWSCLRAHLKRGGLILVDDTLDLLDTAVKVASNDTAPIEEWISSGKIGKPSETQIHTWDNDSQKKFSMLIISPYVLIQERLPTFH